MNLDDLNFKIGNELPYDVVEDLCIYMNNDQNFYRKNLYPELLNVQREIDSSGRYNKKQMLPIIDEAIKQYLEKFEIPKKADNLLTKEEKMLCATKILTAQKELLKNGEYKY